MELELPSSQVMGLFNRAMRKFVQLFSSLEEGVASAGLAPPTSSDGVDMEPIKESVDKELVRLCVCAVSMVMWVGCVAGCGGGTMEPRTAA